MEKIVGQSDNVETLMPLLEEASKNGGSGGQFEALFQVHWIRSSEFATWRCTPRSRRAGANLLLGRQAKRGSRRPGYSRLKLSREIAAYCERMQIVGRFGNVTFAQRLTCGDLEGEHLVEVCPVRIKFGKVHRSFVARMAHCLTRHSSISLSEDQ